MNTQAKKDFLALYFKEHGEDASHLLQKMNNEDLKDFLQEIRGKDVAASLSFMPQDLLADVFYELSHEKSVEIMNLMSPNLVGSLFRHWALQSHFQKEHTASIFEKLEPALRESVEKLLRHGPGTVGSLMNPVPFSVKSNMTVQEVLTSLQVKKHRYSRYIYVVDENYHLEGVLPFKDAFYAEPSTLVSLLMASKIYSLSPDLLAQSVLGKSVWRKWNSVPVVDDQERLLGVVRYDVLEKYVSGKKNEGAEESQISTAGAAIGEVFQIGMNAAVSALGLSSRK